MDRTWLALNPSSVTSPAASVAPLGQGLG
uniref:Uncharacterized protein n=1 Tax=Arundo donax TaxID=35708 RepID=A0A0A9A659_ARUDO